jgi:uncharacterized OB-fold protein
MPTGDKSPLSIYLEHLERGELAYQFSIDAGRPVFFPRVLCPFTGSTRLEWRVSAGGGTVHANTTVHPPEGAPYNVALIDRDEGFRLMSRVEDIAPEEVRIGMRVRVKRSGDGRAVPGLRPAGERMMHGSRRASAALVGVAESDLGQVAEGLSPIDLMAQGIHRAR